MTIDIFCLADTHGAHVANKRIRRMAGDGCDAILHAGDYSVWSQEYEGLAEALLDISVPFLFVTGNHDKPSTARALSKAPMAECMDFGSRRIAGGICVHGLGFPAGIDSHRVKAVDSFAPEIDPAKHNILLTHMPPWPQSYEGGCVGCHAVADWLRRHPVDLIVSGHFHEGSRAWREETLPGGTRLVNPGPTGVLLQINPASRTVECQPVE